MPASVPRTLLLRLIGLALLLGCAGAGAQMLAGKGIRPEDRGRLAGPQAETVLTGRLELVWGDAPPGSETPYRFDATLVDDAGRRHVLETSQALRAAEDLYSLYQRRVAVSVSADDAAASSASGTRNRTARSRAETAQPLLRPQAIVPIDDLSPPGAPRGRVRAQAEAITGPTAWVTLMCKFADIATEQKPLSFFQGQYGNAAGQLDNYWREVSYNKINLTGSIAHGWVTLPEPRSVYVTKGTDGKDKADLGKLFTDCTAAADADVNFGINGGVQGINMMFNGDLDGFAWGGGRCATLDGVNKCWSTTWNPPWSFNNLAPLSHEMGHAYGLPHANNSDNDSDTYDNPWDVMSDAWNNGVSNATYGTLPKHINIYSRNRLGWVDAARKLTINAGTSQRGIAMDRASLAGSTRVQMLTLAYPGQTSRYYTVEVRRRVATYESRLAGDAVIIHEVQTGRKEPAWSQDTDTPAANRANNEGSMLKVGETWVSPDNVFRVTVDSAMTEGFVVTVRSVPRKGGPGQVLPQGAR
jgi:M6 family metalloprotease-like protein